MGFSSFNVITGPVVSAGVVVVVVVVVAVTMTSLVAVPTFPDALMAVYVIVYVPGTSASTAPVTVIASPPSAEAPGSVKEPP